jgi:hypothetical protein
MNSRWILRVLLLLAAVGLAASNGCEINDPFLLALNLPLAVCDSVNEGNTWDEYDEFNIIEEINNISSSYADDVQATRVNDVNVYMPNPPATGTGSGVVLVGLDFDPLDTLLVYTNVPFDSLRGAGISLRSAITNPTQVRFKSSVLNNVLARLQSSNGLPAVQLVKMWNIGSTSVTVPQNTEICARIQYQADVEITP